MTAAMYIDALDASLGSNMFYFSPDKEERLVRLLSLARDIGHGLAAWDDAEVHRVLGGTYGRLVVRRSLDSTGVVLSAREWVQEIQRSRQQERGR